MEIMVRSQLSGTYLEKATALLAEQGLRWDAHIQTTVCLVEDGDVIATGSRHDNVLKCIAVSPEREGDGLTATVVTELIKDAMAGGYPHIFLFTKPENVEKFGSLSFYPVARTDEVALLENRRDGIKKFVAGLERPATDGTVGAIVANCNPFTNGHRYLVETAAAACDLLHLFILSEDRSSFPVHIRMQLAKEGTADLGNVVVHPTSDYLISSATFPDYFIKDQARAEEVNCTLDLTIFAECFAKPMGITRRFVGTEPNCGVTAAYNRQMRQVLPALGVEVVELPRCELEGSAVSAGRVRALLDEKRLEELRSMVPASTFAYLQSM